METAFAKRKEERAAQREHDFLSAIGEKRKVEEKKKAEEKLRQDEGDLISRARKDHENKVKLELSAILGKKKVLPTSEGIFGAVFRKKKRKHDEDGDESGETEKKGDETALGEEK